MSEDLATAIESARAARPAPTRTPAQPVLAIAIEAITAVEDPLVARLIERMALTIVDLSEELRSVRGVLSASLACATKQQLVVDRLHSQIIDIREERRARKATP